VLGPGDEPARDRRLGGPRGGALDVRADGFQPNPIAARRQLGQHPLQRQLIQQLGRGERLVGRHRQLPGAVRGPDPRSTDPHSAAAQGHLAGFGAVPHGGTAGVVAALGADQPGDVLSEQGLQHLQAGPHRQRAQALAGGLGKLSDRDGHLLGQHKLGTVSSGGAVGILRHGGPSWSSDLAVARPLPHGRSPGGDRHLKIYGDRDNLDALLRSPNDSLCRCLMNHTICPPK
jgi:hypothetical protein